MYTGSIIGLAALGVNLSIVVFLGLILGVGVGGGGVFVAESDLGVVGVASLEAGEAAPSRDQLRLL